MFFLLRTFCEMQPCSRTAPPRGVFPKWGGRSPPYFGRFKRVGSGEGGKRNPPSPAGLSPFCPVRKGPPEGVSPPEAPANIAGPRLSPPQAFPPGYVRLQIFDLASRTIPCAEGGPKGRMREQFAVPSGGRLSSSPACIMGIERRPFSRPNTTNAAGGNPSGGVFSHCHHTMRGAKNLPVFFRVFSSPSPRTGPP